MKVDLCFVLLLCVCALCACGCVTDNGYPQTEKKQQYQPLVYEESSNSMDVKTACVDGVVCYSSDSDNMWCTRDCDLIGKYCKDYSGYCNCLNGGL